MLPHISGKTCGSAGGHSILVKDVNMQKNTELQICIHVLVATRNAIVVDGYYNSDSLDSVVRIKCVIKNNALCHSYHISKIRIASNSTLRCHILTNNKTCRPLATHIRITVPYMNVTRECIQQAFKSIWSFQSFNSHHRRQSINVGMAKFRNDSRPHAQDSI